MASNARRARRQKARRGGAEVIRLADARKLADTQVTEWARVVADAAGRPAPEQGQRTPLPNIHRIDRHRIGDLNLDRLIQILRRAEDGDPRDLADLWFRMLKTDDHLRSVWETRTAPVYSARWEVTPDESDATKVDLARRGAEGCAEALRKVPDLPKVFASLLNAVGIGYSAPEIVWTRGTLLGMPAWVPGELRRIHARRFRFSDHFELGLYDDGAAVAAMRDAGWPVVELSSRGARIARLPAGKYIVHQAAGIDDYPTSTGLVHSVARWWWVKQQVTRYWLAGAEIGANPRIIGEMTQDAAGVTMDEFLSQLESLAADGIAITRNGTKITIHPGVAQSTSEVWETLYRRMDLAMSKVVLGSTLNVEIDSTGGNRAAAESQDQVTIRPRQQQDAAQMWASIERDLFRWIIKFNPHIFPPGTPVPRGRSIIVQEYVTIDQLAVDSGVIKVNQLLQSRGLPPLASEIGERFIAPITRSPRQALQPEPASTTADPNATTVPTT